MIGLLLSLRYDVVCSVKVYTLTDPTAFFVGWPVPSYCRSHSRMGKAHLLLLTGGPGRDAQVAVRTADRVDSHILSRSPLGSMLSAALRFRQIMVLAFVLHNRFTSYDLLVVHRHPVRPVHANQLKLGEDTGCQGGCRVNLSKL